MCSFPFLQFFVVTSFRHIQFHAICFACLWHLHKIPSILYLHSSISLMNSFFLSLFFFFSKWVSFCMEWWCSLWFLYYCLSSGTVIFAFASILLTAQVPKVPTAYCWPLSAQKLRFSQTDTLSCLCLASALSPVLWSLLTQPVSVSRQENWIPPGAGAVSE